MFKKILLALAFIASYNQFCVAMKSGIASKKWSVEYKFLWNAFHDVTTEDYFVIEDVSDKEMFNLKERKQGWWGLLDIDPISVFDANSKVITDFLEKTKIIDTLIENKMGSFAKMEKIAWQALKNYEQYLEKRGVNFWHRDVFTWLLRRLTDRVIQKFWIESNPTLIIR